MQRILALGLFLLTACASSSTAPETSSAARRAPGQMPPPTRDSAEPQPSSREIPVDPDDGVWGRADAPVTIVVFTDLECPFCADGHATTTELARRYGPDRARIVIKHCPLAIHSNAIPAARVAQAVLEIGGRRKFFEFIDRAFTEQSKVASGELIDLVSPLGVDLEAVRNLSATEEIGRQIVQDVSLADRLKIAATPHFRVNGHPFTGAYPFEALEPVVEAELREAERLRAQGVASNRIYAERVAANLARAAR